MDIKNHYIAFVLCTFVCITQLNGQEIFTLSGTVKDNGEAIAGVDVDVSEEYFTTTDEVGFYTLTLPKERYVITFSTIDYKTVSKEVDLQEDQELHIEMEFLDSDNEQLNEVVFTGNQSFQKTDLGSPQMSMIELNSSTIKKVPVVLGEADVIKTLQMLPGITNAGEMSSGFNVRGGAEDQNLVLLDEAPVYNSTHLFGLFSIYNADVIKDVELYKGGIPARYGGRISSVLNITQKDGVIDRLKLQGGIGIVSSRLTIETPMIQDKGSFLLAGRGSYGHLFLKLSDNPNSAYFYDINAKANYSINENNHIFLSGYYGYDVFNLENTFKNSYGNSIINLRWNHLFKENLSSNVSLIYSKYNYNLELDFPGLEWDSHIKNYQIKYDFDYHLNKKLRFDFGVNGIYYDFNPGVIKPASANSGINNRTLDTKKAVETSLYFDAEYKMSEKLTLLGGLRFNHFIRLGKQTLNEYLNDLPVFYNPTLNIYQRGVVTGQTTYDHTIKTFNGLEPRFALSYQFNDRSSVKINYNRINQYIHLISNTNSTTPLDVWAPSGKFIEPQKADQIGLGYFRNISEGMYSLETETYYKVIKNRIDYINGADLIANNTIETEILAGEARAYGLEILFRKNRGRLTGWLGYTLAKAEQRTPGGNAGGPGINNGEWYNTSYDRTHNVTLTGNYRLNSKWSFGFNFTYQTGRPVTYPNGQYQYEGLSIPSYSSRNKNRLPAYHHLDISAIYKPNRRPDTRWKGEWIFGFYNIYNRKNTSSITFNQNGETGFNEASRLSIFGIVPTISYNVKF